MSKRVYILLVVILWCHPGFSKSGIKDLESRAIKQLKLRKKSYQEFKKDEERREKLRVAEAGRQKVLRAKHENKKKKARTNFKRVKKKIPYSAYLKFRKLRNRQSRQIENARQEYKGLKKVLEDIHEKSRYKINKMEEYKL